MAYPWAEFHGDLCLHDPILQSQCLAETLDALTHEVAQQWHKVPHHSHGYPLLFQERSQGRGWPRGLVDSDSSKRFNLIQLFNYKIPGLPRHLIWSFLAKSFKTHIASCGILCEACWWHHHAFPSSTCRERHYDTVVTKVHPFLTPSIANPSCLVHIYKTGSIIKSPV